MSPTAANRRDPQTQKKRPRPAQRHDVPKIGLGMLLRNADMIFNRVLREELARHDISFSQYQHLRHLWQNEGLAQVELSRRIGIETASSTAVIEQLEKLKLIRRERDPLDRRRINVSLTDAGRALEGPLDERAVAVNALARRGLTKAQVTALFETVEQIIENLRATDRRPVAPPKTTVAALR